MYFNGISFVSSNDSDMISHLIPCIVEGSSVSGDLLQQSTLCVRRTEILSLRVFMRLSILLCAC